MVPNKNLTVGQSCVLGGLRLFASPKLHDGRKKIAAEELKGKLASELLQTAITRRFTP